MRLQLTIHLSAEEHARLKRVADHHGLNCADVIRMLVKIASDAVEHEEAERLKRLYDCDVESLRRRR